MDRYLVSVIGVAAWGGALWLIVGLRSTRRAAPTRDPGDGPGARLASATGRVAGMAAGGLVAGVLVLGFGGRLLMRVLAATSPDSAQGRLTEAEEVVGAITLGGTLELVLFVGVFGGVAGLVLYAVLRRWLPDRSLVAGLVTAGIGAGLLAVPSGLVDPENRDFTILDPVWLAVALCLGLIVTFALLGAVLMDRWAASWPTPDRSVAGIAGLLPFIPLLLLPPVAVGTAGAIAWCAARPTSSAPGSRLRATDTVVRSVALAAGCAGGAWTLASASQILTA